MKCNCCSPSCSGTKERLIALGHTVDDSDEDIRLESPTTRKRDEPCYCCGDLAVDFVETSLYRWALCSRCVNLTPAWISELKHVMMYRQCNLDYLVERTLDVAFGTTKKG